MNLLYGLCCFFFPFLTQDISIYILHFIDVIWFYVMIVLYSKCYLQVMSIFNFFVIILNILRISSLLSPFVVFHLRTRSSMFLSFQIFRQEIPFGSDSLSQNEAVCRFVTSLWKMAASKSKWLLYVKMCSNDTMS